MKKSLIIIAVLILGAGIFIWQKSPLAVSEKIDTGQQQTNHPKPTTRVEKLEIIDGSTYGKLMSDASITPAITTAIFNATKDVYDLSKIRVGRSLDLVYDIETNDFEKLIYQIDSEDELFVTKHQNGTTTNWLAEIIPIPYEIKIKTSNGVISSSMYEAALDQNIDERAIIDLAEVFQWSVDFALDVRTGDTFKFIYEERYRNGEYIMPGRILAGKYINAGTPIYAFYFEETDENKGYFDENGASVQKIFLKAPVAYKYISSGFTTGKRYVQAFNTSTGHRAIDYAAPTGTPIRAVGDGTVIQAGWNGSYGNFVSIRHNETYTTNYAHQSKIAVRVGQKVKQGDTIGYVGSTGFSTGPHLHYEMVKFGTKINPLTEVFPPGEEISEDKKEEYLKSIEDLKNKLN